MKNGIKCKIIDIGFMDAFYSDLNRIRYQKGTFIPNIDDNNKTWLQGWFYPSGNGCIGSDVFLLQVRIQPLKPI